MSQGLLTVDEAAAELRVTRRTIHRWARERRIPCVRLGRRILFTRAQLDEAIAAYTRHRAEPVDVSAPNPDFEPYLRVVPMKRASGQ